MFILHHIRYIYAPTHIIHIDHSNFKFSDIFETQIIHIHTHPYCKYWNHTCILVSTVWRWLLRMSTWRGVQEILQSLLATQFTVCNDYISDLWECLLARRVRISRNSEILKIRSLLNSLHAMTAYLTFEKIYLARRAMPIRLDPLHLIKVSFAREPYKRDYILQKRHTI